MAEPVTHFASSLSNTASGFALRHVIRWGLGALALAGIGVAFARHRAHSGTPDTDVRARWRQRKVEIWTRALIGGALTGATWSWNSHQSLWLHAVRVAALVLVIGPIARVILQRVRTRPPTRRRRPWSVILGVRLAVVVGGTVEQLLLEQTMSRGSASITTGVTLAVAIGVGGPAYAIGRIERQFRDGRGEVGPVAPTPAE